MNNSRDTSSLIQFPNQKKLFTIGICATDRALGLNSLLRSIEDEPVLEGYSLARIIIVASGCESGVLEFAISLAKTDNRLIVIEEDQRRGKADALNKIFTRLEGDFLILIDSDVFPSKGSIGKLLASISESDMVGLASGNVFIVPHRGLLARFQQLIWSVHNESSLLLNHMGISNHSDGEMMIVRSRLLSALPYGLVNDDAFISARVRQMGYYIRFCRDARVRITVPSRISEFLNQRRRILFGHLQIRRVLGQFPITVESMLFFAPFLSLKILGKTLAKSPSSLLVLPTAILCEILAFLMAIMDVQRSTDRHRIWRRYERNSV